MSASNSETHSRARQQHLRLRIRLKSRINWEVTWQCALMMSQLQMFQVKGLRKQLNGQLHGPKGALKHTKTKSNCCLEYARAGLTINCGKKARRKFHKWNLTEKALTELPLEAL